MGEDDQLRRIGSNIRNQSTDTKVNRPTRNIIRYSTKESPRNEYPKRIVSPPNPSSCCGEENRVMVGKMQEVDGFKFCYKICQVCGHAVKFFFPAVESTSGAVKEYRQWKRYMVQ